MATTKKAAKKKSTDRVIQLDESIDINNVDSFYRDLSDLLKSTTGVVIDAGKIKRLDTTALQLLCSWCKAATDKGIDVKWKNIDGVFFNSAKLLGLTEHLALD